MLIIIIGHFSMAQQGIAPQQAALRKSDAFVISPQPEPDLERGNSINETSRNKGMRLDMGDSSLSRTSAMSPGFEAHVQPAPPGNGPTESQNPPDLEVQFLKSPTVIEGACLSIHPFTQTSNGKADKVLCEQSPDPSAKIEHDYFQPTIPADELPQSQAPSAYISSRMKM